MYILQHFLHNLGTKINSDGSKTAVAVGAGSIELSCSAQQVCIINMYKYGINTE